MTPGHSSCLSAGWREEDRFSLSLTSSGSCSGSSPRLKKVCAACWKNVFQWQEVVFVETKQKAIQSQNRVGTPWSLAQLPPTQFPGLPTRRLWSRATPMVVLCKALGPVFLLKKKNRIWPKNVLWRKERKWKETCEWGLGWFTVGIVVKKCNWFVSTHCRCSWR